MEATIHEEEEEQLSPMASQLILLAELNNHDEMMKKYGQNKIHFYLNKIVEDNQDSIFQWIYQYGNKYQMILEYSQLNRFWKLILIDSNSLLVDQNRLIHLLDKMNQSLSSISFEQQVRLIRSEFDQYFSQFDQDHIELQENEQHEIDLPVPTSIIRTDQNQIEVFLEQQENENRIDLPILTPIIQSDQHLSTPNHRIRQDSGCSSTNSLRYTEFVPPSKTNVRHRRVIQSIQIQVQQKKTFFRTIVDKIKTNPIEPILYRLGLQFLRLYDGKFNYPLGHTFILLFENQTWFLTITDIKCVQCQLGQSEPRSTLILNYKNKSAHVQV